MERSADGRNRAENQFKISRSSWLILLLAPVSAFILAASAQAADIEDLRLWRAPEYTRVVFDLNANVDYQVFTLTNPERVVIDISASTLRSDISSLDLKDSPIRNVRSAVRNGSDVRVVFDVDARVKPVSFSLEPSGEFGDRLVVDLYDQEQSAVAVTQAPPETQSYGQRDIVVAIDPGHGGEDPGAIGYDGKIREKDVALAVSRAIYERLEAASGYHPILIRDSDYYVQLEERPALARQHRADIFLSIHADAFRNSAAEGVTIYALSEKIADDENARRVAQKENGADLLGGVAGDTSLRNIEDDLALTLLDLSMAWSIEQSISAGSHILASLDGVAKLRRSKAQQGNLWVLRSPDIPSLLIETGYLTNPGEARKLTNPAYQRRLADGIVQGVMNYFYERPPDGSLVAWQKENNIAPSSYIVRRGDSLSEIGQRYNVGVSQLKAVNGLSGNSIRIGQKLVIPSGAASAAASEHKIARGETLSEIAELYRVSLNRLRQANDLSNDIIRIGQVLTIPAF